jgi:hypothetical protein
VTVKWFKECKIHKLIKTGEESHQVEYVNKLWELESRHIAVMDLANWTKLTHAQMIHVIDPKWFLSSKDTVISPG